VPTLQLLAVDIYVNGQLGFPDLAFRGATPYIPITANFPIRVGIAPGNSTSYNDTIKTWLYFFEADTNYIAEAVGVVGSGFAANPNGISTALDIVVKQGTSHYYRQPGHHQLLRSTRFHRCTGC
jgi:hypothetical protein